MKTHIVLPVLVGISVASVIVVSQPLEVISFSMEPTFQKGDLVLTETLTLSVLSPQRGGLIVYKDPRQTEKPLVIKRVVGLPTETVVIERDLVSVRSGFGAATTFAPDSNVGRRDNGQDWQITLGKEDYLLMGDNRAGSKDGRQTGTIQPSEMYGRPWLILWPLSRIGFPN